MGSADEAALQPLNPFTKGMNRRDLNKKFNTIRKESQEMYWKQRELQMMENYKQALYENFNKNDVKDIAAAIDNMGFEEFYAIWQSEGADFDAAYPPDDEQYAAYLTALRAIWIPQKGAA